MYTCTSTYSAYLRALSALHKHVHVLVQYVLVHSSLDTTSQILGHEASLNCFNAHYLQIFTELSQLGIICTTHTGGNDSYTSPLILDTYYQVLRYSNSLSNLARCESPLVHANMEAAYSIEELRTDM